MASLRRSVFLVAGSLSSMCIQISNDSSGLHEHRLLSQNLQSTNLGVGGFHITFGHFCHSAVGIECGSSSKIGIITNQRNRASK
ncbi:hypothetical protein C8R41DRAFT_842148 [Lentinula lateritia]|uniref:Uncharacterized protein n=1 Tax=Lentinula lateritia TaxID=40482 RepID=A0ABQ8V8T7_9AGAR|nr:hypothetical protein C8R41DRAFT_842148 [Lentinula lateritia]